MRSVTSEACPSKPQTSESRLGISQTQSLSVATLLIVLVSLLPYTPNLANAFVRLFLWIFFIRYSVGLNFLWKPGPSSWFIVSFSVFYGSWIFFFITGTLFFSETLSFLSVCRSAYPVLGFQVDTGCFLFIAIAWFVVRLFCVKGVFSVFNPSLGQISSEIPPDARLFVLGAGILGGIASLPQLQLSGALAQPLLLLSLLYNASIAVLLISTPRSGKWSRFKYLILLISVFGFVAFLSSGSKGSLFLNLLYFVWLAGSVFPTKRLQIYLALAVVVSIFVITLPAFQKAKEEYSRTRSSSRAFNTLSTNLMDALGGKIEYSNGRVGRGEIESLWEYLGIRLCVSTMTQKYVEVYGDSPMGYDTFYFAISNMVPRILDQNKVSSDQYYNELARQSGIGNKSDFETSRKPSFVDEFVVAMGWEGFVYGGIAFGLYLIALEVFCFRIADTPQSLAVMRFICLALGQTPYIASILGAVPYSIVFLSLTVALYLKEIWPKNQNVLAQ